MESEQQAEKAPAAEAPPASDKAPPAAEAMIPRARLNEVIGERDGLRSELDGLRAELEKLKPYQEQVGGLQAQLEQVKALSRAGIIDDDGQAVAGMLYERLAEKPEGGIGAWLSGFEDPSKAPRPLQPYLVKPAPAAPPAAPAAARPDPNKTAVAAVDGRLSPEALAEVNKRAMRGDKDAHDAIRRHMRASGYL